VSIRKWHLRPGESLDKHSGMRILRTDHTAALYRLFRFAARVFGSLILFRHAAGLQAAPKSVAFAQSPEGPVNAASTAGPLRRHAGRLCRHASWTALVFALSACVGSSGLEASSQRLDDSREAKPLSDATILIIRHAEKPPNGSGLDADGQARAEAYVRYFQNFRAAQQVLRFDYLVAADDSEHSQRSRLTLEPLARAIGLKPDLRFQAKRPQDLAEELRSKGHGKNILICWHHREIPDLLKALGADPERLLPHGEWPAQQFGWVLQLRYDHEGRLVQGKTRRIKEHLMPGD